MKGIILAGGSGTRLYPSSISVSKQLMPIYDKPMIYYPLSTLMLSGIREILIISSPENIDAYRDIFRDGQNMGMKFEYKVQQCPEGIAQALIIGEEFIGKDTVCLILGDNIFYGHGLPEKLRNMAQLEQGAAIFGYRVTDPERYGVIVFNKSGRPVGIEEKPKKPKSNYVIPGIYFYDNNVSSIAKKLKLSARKELEITDVNVEYLKQKSLKVEMVGRGITWLDTGTPESLLDAADFVATIEKRQGHKIACIEEVAYRMGYVSEQQLKRITESMPKSSYRKYLEDLLEQGI